MTEDRGGPATPSAGGAGQDDQTFGAVLTARFHAGTSSALGDLRISVYARIARTQHQPRVVANRRLQVVYNNALAEESLTTRLLHPPSINPAPGPVDRRILARA